MTGKSAVAFATLMLLHATGTWAQSSDTPRLSFDGFGTFGLVYSDEDQADFVADLTDPDGVGHSNEVSPEIDSRLGLQLTAEVMPRLSAVAQVIFEQRYDGTYRPEFEWANINYDLNPHLSVRAGRMILPTFLVSEYRNVGFALPWIRPPLEVYRLVPVSSADAVSLTYSFRAGNFNHRLQSLYGRRDLEFADDAQAKAREAATLAYSLEHGATTFHANYSKSRLTIEGLEPFFDAFRQFGPPGEAIADRFGAEDKSFEIMNLGARYDPGQWFVMGEIARTEVEGFIPDNHAAYVSGGYRFGSITPYLTLAWLDVDSETSVSGLPVTDLPPSLAEVAGRLNAGLNGLLGSAPAQKSLSLGARWDFARNFDLKLQLDRMDLENGSPGFMINRQPGFQRGGSVTLLSATLDFVF